MCSCDFDPPSAMTETRRRARKPHWCVECRSPISVGRASSKGHRSAIELDTPRPLDPDPRVDALRAALAKVPR